MRNLVCLLCVVVLSNCTSISKKDAYTSQIELEVKEGEYWWAGLSALGHQTPYDKNSITSIDTWGDNRGNQAQPILLSNKGRYIWSEEPLKYEFNKGKLRVSTRKGEILSGESGDDLKSGFQYAVNNFFPPNHKIPHELLFTHPQYNTWIELTYDQNEEDILIYAQAIIDNGYPPGVLMIDDNWQENYGVWEFSPRRFKDPIGMVEKLHKMGFQVMLWICPFVSPDSENYRKLEKNGLLVLEGNAEKLIPSAKNPALIRWWNGASACLDLSNPASRNWFKSQLDYLVNEYGVDGFKFDAGDADFYVNNIVTHELGSPNDQTMHFAKLGLDYPLNEYRASWKMAGLPLVQRLRDKEHKWEDLQKLIPDMMSQSLMGYAYTCPDMIGGGEFKSFQNLSNMDEELVVRSAQVHALMPMMQFSVAPWRVLSKKNNKICQQAALLHLKMGNHILSLAEEAAKTGEPIVKPMAFAYPNQGYEMIKDQFVLGTDFIVTPVVKKGERRRLVTLPKGKWKADDGTLYEGGKSIAIKVPLDRLPYFQKV